MSFQPLSHEQIQQRRLEFVRVFNEVFIASGMSMNAVAGDNRGNFYDVLKGNKHPGEYTLAMWCQVFIDHGVINRRGATYIMNLAGHSTSGQQQRAMQGTTEHRIPVVAKPPQSTRVNTDELPDPAKNYQRASEFQAL